MLTLLALAALQVQGKAFKLATYDGIQGRDTVVIRTLTERATAPKLSPKKFGEPPRAWEFDWVVAGYAQMAQVQSACFEIFSQESTLGSARPEGVARMLMRLYGYNVERLLLEHHLDLNFGMISVYLCYGGEPGGEQLYDYDPQTNRKVNTIYFYDLRSLTSPVEAAREVAHEYGHATLPPFGGYSEPENWANGLLGEKLYLPYLADAIRKGELASSDAMGATVEKLDAWTKVNVDPLLASAALHGPQPSVLAGKSKASMDAALGLVLWTARLYDGKVMKRALVIGGTDAKSFPEAASTAAEEPALTTLNIPSDLRSKPIWIPVGKDKKKTRIFGAAELTDRKNGWVRIQPGAGPVIVRNYQD